MAFAIPTLRDLVERSRRAFRDHLPGSDAWLWPNNVAAAAKVYAGGLHELFGFADYIARQIFALTADSEHLDLHGEELGMARRPAAPARGRVELVATTAIEVAIGAEFRRADGGTYRATQAASLAGAGTLAVDVVAALDGAATNAEAGAPLEIVGGVTGFGVATVHDDGIRGGADVEDDDSFRARILFRKRNPPHGGAPADYVLWASAVPGVTRVFVERRPFGPGTVKVYPLMDDLYDHGTAPPAEIARVADTIALDAPAGAVVTVSPPTPVPIDVVIEGLSPDTLAVREAVQSELRATFRRLSRVAGNDAGHSAMPYLAAPATFSRSWLWQAIANAAGEERHVVVEPEADVSLAAGEIAVLGTVTFEDA